MTKKHSLGGEPIDIRRSCGRLLAKRPDPVVQVVDDDEENVWAWGGDSRAIHKRGEGERTPGGRQKLPPVQHEAPCKILSAWMKTVEMSIRTSVG